MPPTHRGDLRIFRALSVLLGGVLLLQIVIILYHDTITQMVPLHSPHGVVWGQQASALTAERSPHPPQQSDADDVPRTPSSPRYAVDILGILEKAGVWLDEELVRILPTPDEVESMYGSTPVILGLEHCEKYRNSVDEKDRIIGAAGIFNTGTNLLGKLMLKNCFFPEKIKAFGKNSAGMRDQVPWGKHNPVSWRLHHVAQVGGMGINQTDVLPVVMVKDPVSWMSSMCRHPYTAFWRHTQEHCPNLVPNEFDPGKYKDGYLHLRVKFPNKTFVGYKTLVGLWNSWYSDWVNDGASFPHLFVRFEDLLFHAERVVKAVCDCGGGQLREKFHYVEDSAKGQGGAHRGSAGLVASISRYGNKTLRGSVLTSADRTFAEKEINQTLLQMFHYTL